MKGIAYLSIEAMVIVIVLLVGVSLTGVATTLSAQIGLGKPIYVETERIIDQKEIGPNRTQLTVLNNGTLNENIEIIG